MRMTEESPQPCRRCDEMGVDGEDAIAEHEAWWVDADGVHHGPYRVCETCSTAGHWEGPGYRRVDIRYPDDV